MTLYRGECVACDRWEILKDGLCAKCAEEPSEQGSNSRICVVAGSRINGVKNVRVEVPYRSRLAEASRRW